MVKNKPFKIDIGFGDLYGNSNIRTIKTNPVLPTFTGERYAIWTNRDGVVVKHPFRSARRAKAFLETAKASGSYSTVSDIQLDY